MSLFLIYAFLEVEIKNRLLNEFYCKNAGIKSRLYMINNTSFYYFWRREFVVTIGFWDDMIHFFHFIIALLCELRVQVCTGCIPKFTVSNFQY